MTILYGTMTIQCMEVAMQRNQMQYTKENNVVVAVYLEGGGLTASVCMHIWCFCRCSQADRLSRRHTGVLNLSFRKKQDLHIIVFFS